MVEVVIVYKFIFWKRLSCGLVLSSYNNISYNTNNTIDFEVENLKQEQHYKYTTSIHALWGWRDSLDPFSEGKNVDYRKCLSIV